MTDPSTPGTRETPPPVSYVEDGGNASERPNAGEETPCSCGWYAAMWRERHRADAAEAKLDQVREFVAERARYITAIENCHPDNASDYHRWQGGAEARRQLAQRLGLPVAWPAGHPGNVEPVTDREEPAQAHARGHGDSPRCPDDCPPGSHGEEPAGETKPRETSAADDPVGTFRDTGNATTFEESNPLAHVNRYFMKWAPAFDRDETHPWVAINHEAGLQRMPNDLMDRYPVVSQAEVQRRIAHGQPVERQADSEAQR